MFKKLIASLLLLAAALTAFAQVKGVNGKVTDDKGEAVVGAAVSVKGTSIGTMTDPDGSYRLPSAVASDATLVSSPASATPRRHCPLTAARWSMSASRRITCTSTRPSSWAMPR